MTKVILAEQQNITMRRGDTFHGFERRLFTQFEGGDPKPLDISAARIRMHIRDKRGMGKVVQKFSSDAAGGIIRQLRTGAFYLDAFRCQLEIGEYGYDVELTEADGTITTIIEGFITVLSDRTI